MLNFGIPFDSKKQTKTKKDMKKIFRFAAMAAAAAALFSCQEPVTPEPGPNDEPGTGNTPELNVDIKFTLAVEEVECDKAKIKVEHDGERTDTWYGFVTTASDIDQAIDDEVAALVASGKVSLQKSTSKTVTVRDLEAETAYTYVVFGLSDQGQVYGEPASVEFTTAKAAAVFTENPAWKVEYAGAGVVEGKSYEHVIRVTSTDNNTYFTSVYPQEVLDEYGIEVIAAEEIAYWTEYIASFNAQNGTNYDFSAILYSGSIEEGWNLEAGYTWVAIAIGADATGTATGHYAVSAPITVEEEEMTSAYASWVGDWVITGSNGLTQNVTFSKGVSNKSFVMTGYEGDDAAGLDVTVQWDAESECWYIYNQNLGTYSFGSYGNGEIWFLGEGEDESLYLSDSLPICVGGTFEDGSLGAVGYAEEWTNEDGTPGSYKVVTMEYLAYLLDHEQLSYITGTYETGYPTFPMTFTPATRSASTTEAAAKEVKATKAAQPLQSYNVVNTFKTSFQVR